MTHAPTPVPPAIRRLLDTLEAGGVCRDFYLAGGTGLALVLSHRRSVDLDFFSRTNRLDFEGRRGLLARLRQLQTWKLSEATDGTVHGWVGRVRVSFLWYPEPLVKPFVWRGTTRIASLEDIGLMKLGAIIGRGSRKDFVDLYAICQRIPIARLLALGQRKFGDFDDFTLQALKALNFFDDAERDPAVAMAVPVPWALITAFFRQEVRTLTRQRLSRWRSRRSFRPR